MKAHMILLCGIPAGIIVWLLLAHGSKYAFPIGNTITCTTNPLHLPRLAVYNKSCGVQYWSTGRNFGNKDDMRFFRILSESLIPTQKEIIIIEFGANTGQFSEILLGTPHETPYVVHSIEPITVSFDVMKNRSMTFKKQQNDMHFQHNIAISDRSGRLPIHAPRGIGEAATLGRGLQSNFDKISDVFTQTLPDFIKKYRIKTPISFVKIDVEGFEPEVISGMHLKANSHIFPLFLFETGGTWRDDRSVLARNVTLKSFVATLNDLGYDSFFIGYPYLLPLTGVNWSDSFDGFVRNPNVLSALRCSEPWKNLLMFNRCIDLNSCSWE